MVGLSGPDVESSPTRGENHREYPTTFALTAQSISQLYSGIYCRECEQFSQLSRSIQRAVIRSESLIRFSVAESLGERVFHDDSGLHG